MATPIRTAVLALLALVAACGDDNRPAPDDQSQASQSPSQDPTPLPTGTGPEAMFARADAQLQRAWQALDQEKLLRAMLDAQPGQTIRRDLFGAAPEMDPWETPIRLVLIRRGQREGSSFVGSAGPDGEFGTADDRRFPKPDAQ